MYLHLSAGQYPAQAGGAPARGDWTMGRSFWVVVACGAMMLTLATGVRMNFGLFMPAITKDLRISVELFSFGLAAGQLLMGLVSPLAGALMTRFGIVPVGVAGSGLYVLSLALMALSVDGGTVTLANALGGIAIGLASFSLVFGAVGRAAPPEKRSLALGLATAGGSFGQFAIVPLGSVLLDVYGWRSAMWVLAALSASMIVLALGLRTPPAPAGSAPPAAAQTTREALAEAFGHRDFVLLTTAFFVCGFHVTFVSTHLPNFIASHGVGMSLLGAELSPAKLGGVAIGLIGLFNIVGTLAAGFLGGRYRKKNLLALIYTSRAVLFAALVLLPLSGWTILGFSIVFGLLFLSTVPLTSGLVGYVFGPTHMATLYGVVFLSHQVGAFLGAWLAGRMFDATGDYVAMWWLSVALGVAAAILHWPIAERPVPRLAARPAE